MVATSIALIRLSQAIASSSSLRLTSFAARPARTALPASAWLRLVPYSLPPSHQAARSFCSCSRLRSAESSSGTADAIAQDDDDERTAWVERLKETKSIPRDLVEITYTRSSGPGGQNINKVSTKANVRLDLSRLRAGVPSMKLPPIPATGMKLLAQQSPYYVASAHALGLSSSKSRSQDANTEDALEKLHAHLLSVVSQGIRGKTSEEQKARVRKLQAGEKRRKEASKRKRSDVKGGRKKVIL